MAEARRRAMNKAALRKGVGTDVRIRPIAKRFDGGPGGALLPSQDDDWRIQGFHPNGITISNNRVPYQAVLGFDQVREFMTDPGRGIGYGFLILKVHLNIGGNFLWTEPILPEARSRRTRLTGDLRATLHLANMSNGVPAMAGASVSARRHSAAGLSMLACFALVGLMLRAIESRR